MAEKPMKLQHQQEAPAAVVQGEARAVVQTGPVLQAPPPQVRTVKLDSSPEMVPPASVLSATKKRAKPSPTTPNSATSPTSPPSNTQPQLKSSDARTAFFASTQPTNIKTSAALTEHNAKSNGGLDTTSSSAVPHGPNSRLNSSSSSGTDPHMPSQPPPPKQQPHVAVGPPPTSVASGNAPVATKLPVQKKAPVAAPRVKRQASMENNLDAGAANTGPSSSSSSAPEPYSTEVVHFS